MNELIAQTKEYLLQNYALTDRIFANKEDYKYFVDFALQQKPGSRPSPTRRPPPPPPPIIKMKPKPKPIEKPKEEPLAEPKKVELAPQKKAAEIDLSDIRKTFEKKFPNIKVLDTPPDDIVAKQKKGKEAEVILIATSTNPKENAFLHHLANAIDHTLAPAAVLTQTEAAEKTAKLFICSEETTAEPKLITLPLSSYLNDPTLKAKLWEDISESLKS